MILLIRSYKTYKRKDFHDDIALKLLYFSLVCSHLEYACLQYLSKVQNNFLRFLCYQCNVRRNPHSGYDIAHNFFTIMPLDKRFQLLALKFLHKLLNNLIDCPELIERLNFKINYPSSRYKPIFYMIKVVIDTLLRKLCVKNITRLIEYFVIRSII